MEIFLGVIIGILAGQIYLQIRQKRRLKQLQDHNKAIQFDKDNKDLIDRIVKAGQYFDRCGASTTDRRATVRKLNLPYGVEKVTHIAGFEITVAPDVLIEVAHAGPIFKYLEVPANDRRILPIRRTGKFDPWN